MDAQIINRSKVMIKLNGKILHTVNVLIKFSVGKSSVGQAEAMDTTYNIFYLLWIYQKITPP